MPRRLDRPGSFSERRSSRSRELNLRISGTTVRYFLVGLIGADMILILGTALSDLEYPLVAEIESLQLLDLKREGNIAVWYSSAILLLTSVAAFAVAKMVFRIERNSRLRSIWTMAALFFLWLSVDETARLHETAGELFVSHVGNVPGLTEGGLPVFAWLLVLLPFAILFLVCMLLAARWCFRISRRSGLLMVAGMVCWIGVLCAEFVEAQLVRWSMERGLHGAAEEGLEIIGTTLFLIAFLDLLRAEEQHASFAGASFR